MKLLIKKYRLIFALPLILLQYGCYSNVIRDYIQLSKVTSPVHSSNFQETAFGRYNQVYDEQNFRIYFDFNRADLGIYVVNKIDSTMEIIWDSSKVLSNYELAYELIDYNPKGFIKDYFDVKWENNSGKIICTITKQMQKPMLIDTTDGSVKLGSNIFYGFGYNNFKNYTDKYLKIHFDFTPDKIIMVVENQSKAIPIIKEEEGKLVLRRTKSFQIFPSSFENKLSIDRKSLILGIKIFYDDIITNSLKENSPYYFSSPRSFIQFSKDYFECKSLQLILKIKQNNTFKNYIFFFDVNDYQVLRKG